MDCCRSAGSGWMVDRKGQVMGKDNTFLWLLVGGIAVYLLLKDPNTQVGLNTASSIMPASHMPIVGGPIIAPAWTQTAAGQAWVIASENNNVVNPPGTLGWYAWQAANPAPVNAK